MTIPNVGVNGVIQSPGLGGALGQGIGGIAQMLQQIEQMRIQQAQQQASQAYQEGLIRQQEAATQDRREAARKAEEAERKLAEQRRQIGEAVRGYMTPTDTQVTVPTVGVTGQGSGPTLRITAKTKRGIDEVIRQLPPELVPTFLETTKEERGKREASAEQGQRKAELQQVIAQLPEELQPIVSVVLPLQQNGMPAEVTTSVYGQLLQNNPKTAATIAKIKERVPQLALLPDNMVVPSYVDYLRQQFAAQFRPRTTEGTPPTTRTPAQIRQELLGVQQQIQSATQSARDLGNRPNTLQSPAGNRPFVPRTAADSINLNTFLTDSANARDYLKELQRQQALLNQELQMVQGSPLAAGTQTPGVTVQPITPTEREELDPISGRRIAVDTVTGARRYLEPPK